MKDAVFFLHSPLVGWPWLAVRCPDPCSLTPLSQEDGKKIGWKTSRVKTRTGRSLTNYCLEQNRLNLRKNNFIILSVFLTFRSTIFFSKLKVVEEILNSYALGSRKQMYLCTFDAIDYNMYTKLNGKHCHNGSDIFLSYILFLMHRIHNFWYIYTLGSCPHGQGCRVKLADL